jgi:hypothetical protein
MDLPGDSRFIHPHGIAVDFQGNVFVADEERQDVQKFTVVIPF